MEHVEKNHSTTRIMKENIENRTGKSQIPKLGMNLTDIWYLQRKLINYHLLI